MVDQLSKLGNDFEMKLLRLIIGDKTTLPNGTVQRFYSEGMEYVHALEPMLFENEHCRKIYSAIKEHHKKYNSIPYFDSIKYAIRSKLSGSKEQADFFIAFIDSIEKIQIDDKIFLNDLAKKFIYEQNVKLALQKALKIIEERKQSEYGSIQALVEKATNSFSGKQAICAFGVGDTTDLDEKPRNPIPIGFGALDEDLGGGIAAGELMLIIAALKVGKTTSACQIAFTASKAGYCVLHVYFEDTESQVRAKYRAKASGLNLGEVRNKKNRMKIVKLTDHFLKTVENKGGLLIPVKLSADEDGVDTIKNIIHQIEDIGVMYPGQDDLVKRKVDLVIVDYMDCLKPKEVYAKGQEWASGKEIMRDLERLCKTLELAGIAFTQGGRNAIDNEIVGTKDGSGDIRKSQIAHIIISMAKTQEQRANKTGNIAILGSRVGGDGVVYKNAIFDNGAVNIWTEKNDLRTVADVLKEAGVEESVYDDSLPDDVPF